MGRKIQDLPSLERPREKAIRYGFDTLSDAEVLAIIISCGTKESSALDIAHEILSKFGGLYNVINEQYGEFLKIKGIKQSKATKLSAVFEIARRFNSLRISFQEEKIMITSEYLYKKYINELVNLDHEVLIIVVLNLRKKIIYERTLFEGSNNKVIFSIRDILKTVVSHSGVYFYVIHNHPSGNINPSDEDIDFTLSLLSACEKIGITLLDHLIIGKNTYYSFFNSNVKEETDENKD